MELDLTKYKVEVVLAELDDPIVVSVIGKPGYPYHKIAIPWCH